jgi:hypothetical protein
MAYAFFIFSLPSFTFFVALRVSTTSLPCWTIAA